MGMPLTYDYQSNLLKTLIRECRTSWTNPCQASQRQTLALFKERACAPGRVIAFPAVLSNRRHKCARLQLFHASPTGSNRRPLRGQ